MKLRNEAGYDNKFNKTKLKTINLNVASSL